MSLLFDAASQVKLMYSIEDLRFLIRRLRDPKTGCPWDIEQDYASITPSTIEEAYEVVDAIDHGDKAQLKEELGDLLFQIIFYNQLAEEEGAFRFEEIVDGLTAKLIRRHPHVFTDGALRGDSATLSNSENAEAQVNQAHVKAQWENIKQAERKDKGLESVLDDVPLALPALTRAQKLQKRAARINLDWKSPKDVLTKLNEEVEELNEAVSQEDINAIEAELGDCLFTLVNVARHYKLDAESALKRANQKFSERVKSVESQLNEQAQLASQLTMEEMDVLWQKAKGQKGSV